MLVSWAESIAEQILQVDAISVGNTNVMHIEMRVSCFAPFDVLGR